MKRKRYPFHSSVASSTSSAQGDKRSRCTVCLQSFDNETFLRPCFHSFCFVCIRQWLNVTPSCPLCKQAIDALIYHIDDDTTSYQEYKVDPRATKHHPPSQPPPRATAPQRWNLRRRHLYRHLLPVVDYPQPPSTHASPVTLVEPRHIPKVLPFLRGELLAILGTAPDEFTASHIQQLLLIPYNQAHPSPSPRGGASTASHASATSTSMHDTTLLQELADWLGEDTRVASRLIDELLAYLYSGLSYMSFVQRAQYDDSHAPPLELPSPEPEDMDDGLNSPHSVPPGHSEPIDDNDDYHHGDEEDDDDDGDENGDGRGDEYDYGEEDSDEDDENDDY
ncbi:hypothetical protein BC940DRAFT_128729 [Gongronella butleri]|nr:hypothetical protein BC940DRAFT_128729 [Gongronella butleri]